ncbi:hypothetical protein [Embleya sp. NPDC020630]
MFRITSTNAWSSLRRRPGITIPAATGAGWDTGVRSGSGAGP